MDVTPNRVNIPIDDAEEVDVAVQEQSIDSDGDNWGGELHVRTSSPQAPPQA